MIQKNPASARADCVGWEDTHATDSPRAERIIICIIMFGADCMSEAL